MVELAQDADLIAQPLKVVCLGGQVPLERECLTIVRLDPKRLRKRPPSQGPDYLVASDPTR